jgi:transcriptional regulator with XRE-family HTH domain
VTPSPIIRELTAIRLERGLSMNQVAADLTVNCSCLSDWERGHHSPTLRNLERWAAVLGYELDLHVKETCDD